jgi:hypothetical protein
MRVLSNQEDHMFSPDFIVLNRLAIYLPNRNCFEEEIPDIGKWIDEAAFLLTTIAGGATIIEARGMWMNRISGKIINERTAIVYANVDYRQALKDRPLIDDFIARFGHETLQDSVSVEYGGKMYFISDYKEQSLKAIA